MQWPILNLSCTIGFQQVNQIENTLRCHSAWKMRDFVSAPLKIETREWTEMLTSQTG